METKIIQGAEPFLLPGGKTGCVLVHGFTGTPKEMRLMGDFLAQNRITSLGIRLAGHATQESDMRRTRWEDWLASVDDGFNILRKSCDRIFLAGLSMGAALSLTASTYLKTNGVIAISAPFEIKKDWRIGIAKPLSIIYPKVKKDRSDTEDQEKAREHIDYPSYPTRSIAELNELLTFMRSQLQNISVPVLMINSKKDQSVPFSHQEQIIFGLGSSQIESLMLEESGHVITEDVERKIVFDKALNFINHH